MTKMQYILARLGIVVVIASSAWNSYWHIVHVAVKYGQDDISAHMLPLSVDGLMLAASTILEGAKSKLTRFLAWSGFLAGFALSVLANMISVDSGVLGYVFSGWYAVSLLVGVHLWQHTGRKAMEVKQTEEEVAAAELAAKRSEAAKRGVETKRRNNRKRTTTQRTTTPRKSRKTVEAADTGAPDLRLAS